MTDLTKLTKAQLVATVERLQKQVPKPWAEGVDDKGAIRAYAELKGISQRISPGGPSLVTITLDTKLVDVLDLGKKPSDNMLELTIVASDKKIRR
jgi:hypothetical protein